MAAEKPRMPSQMQDPSRFDRYVRVLLQSRLLAPAVIQRTLDDFAAGRDPRAPIDPQELGQFFVDRQLLSVLVEPIRAEMDSRPPQAATPSTRLSLTSSMSDSVKPCRSRLRR